MTQHNTGMLCEKPLFPFGKSETGKLFVPVLWRFRSAWLEDAPPWFFGGLGAWKGDPRGWNMTLGDNKTGQLEPISNSDCTILKYNEIASHVKLFRCLFRIMPDVESNAKPLQDLILSWCSSERP